MLASLFVTLSMVGCTPEQRRGFLPGDTAHEVTNHTGQIMNTWVAAWVTLLLVGALVWGLIIWCVIAYRRHSTDKGFPVQLRYHVPLEMMFTLIPIVLIMSMFYFTHETISKTEALDPNPDVTVQVVGKQWTWDFNYLDAGVHEPAGVQSARTGLPGAEAELPTLYLPVNKTVQFDLESRDVIHSFWVVDFLYKRDMIPGHTQKFQVTPTKEGTYKGKCAELCGAYHSDMLFNLKVVSQEEFDKHMEELRAQGLTGALDIDLNRNQEEWSMRKQEGAKK
ncbi:aa3-type cytochrome oxidase subunit II [Dermabacteraceae bacterium P13077]